MHGSDLGLKAISLSLKPTVVWLLSAKGSQGEINVCLTRLAASPIDSRSPVSFPTCSYQKPIFFQDALLIVLTCTCLDWIGNLGGRLDVSLFFFFSSFFLSVDDCCSELETRESMAGCAAHTHVVWKVSVLTD